MEDLLTKVANILSSLQLQTSQILPAGSPCKEITSNTLSIPPLELDTPRADSIVEKLMAVGMPNNNALELSQIHQNSCIELAQQYIELYNDTCRGVSEEAFGGPFDLNHSRMLSRIRKLSHRYSMTVVAWEEDLIESARLRVEERDKIEGPSRLSRKVFNTSYLPKLEAFFKINPKPSRADRVFLAKQSGMSLRQINVWFQNHRARVQKENGKKATASTSTYTSSMATRVESITSEEASSPGQIQRKDIEEDSCIDVLSDTDTIPGDHSSQGRANSRLSSWSSSSTLVEEELYPLEAEYIDPFFTKAPSHAFPTQYPPTLDSIIFPCRFGDFSFPKPSWTHIKRHPMMSRYDDEMDILALATAFEKLSLHSASPDAEEGTFDRPTTTEWPCNASSNRTSNASYPFFTITPSAPMPSLIRTPRLTSIRNKFKRCLAPGGDAGSRRILNQLTGTKNPPENQCCAIEAPPLQMRKKHFPFTKRLPSRPHVEKVSSRYISKLPASYISSWSQESDVVQRAALTLPLSVAQ